LRRFRRRIVFRDKQVAGQHVVPHRAVDRAAGRLIFRGEQLLDLLVGPVESAGGARLLFTLAGQLQGRLDEGLGVGFAFCIGCRDIHFEFCPQQFYGCGIERDQSL